MPLVSLARGETESFQVVMTSPRALLLRNLSWSVALGGPHAHSEQVTAESFLVGFAHSVKLPPWLSRTKVPAPARLAKRPLYFAPRSVRRALLIPKANPGSRYRGGESA